MSSPLADLPRLRQAVLVATELESVAGTLKAELGLGEPFADPAIEYFGLRNAVFALGDTFLEVISPSRSNTSAGRVLARHGQDCGYMVMFQVGDLLAARGRANAQQVREVFEVELDDIAEVHLHPADMRGAIVALSSPRPRESWRWGGPGWSKRSVPLRLARARIAVADPASVGKRWSTVLGAPLAAVCLELTHDDAEPGLVEIAIETGDGFARDPIEIAGVQFTFFSSCRDCEAAGG